MDDSSPPSSSAALERVLDRSRTLGFLGPGAVSDHIEHAQAYLDGIRDRATVLDLGSGGGVPGLVLAMSTSAEWTLVDAMEKRCRFLEWAVAELGLTDRVEVRCGRAEALARVPELRHHFDAVVARSFGPPAVTAECAAGFLVAGGRLVVSEPPEAASTARWPSEGVARLGLRIATRHRHGGATVQILEVEQECSDEFPRRVGVPSKRPLF